MTDKTNSNYRWIICLLLFAATSINYIDRQIIGLLKPTLEAQFKWTESDYSYIIAAFTASYAIGQIFFGIVIDKIGTRKGYSISISIWSVAAMLHAAVKSTFGFGAVRVMLGIGEAGNFPSAIRAVAEWFPKKERALATGIFNSGSNIGALVAPVFVPWVLGVYGWQAAFVATGAIGFIWLIFWLLFYEVPSRQKRANAIERAYILKDQNDDEQSQEGVEWLSLLKIRQTWTFVIGKFLTDPIWYFFLFWLPSYFSTTFHLNLSKPSLPLVVVYSATTIGSIGGGYLSSFFIKKGWAPFKARKIAMLLFALAVVPIISARYATSLWQAIALISLAAAAHQAWSANIFTTASDVFPKRAVGSVVGLGGMAGATGGALFPFLIGFILDHYKRLGHLTTGYNLLFTICGFAYILAWLIMHLLSPREKKVELS